MLENKLFTQDEVDDALAEGFVAGALHAREAERDRIKEAIEALDVVVMHVSDIFAILHR